MRPIDSSRVTVEAAVAMSSCHILLASTDRAGIAAIARVSPCVTDSAFDHECLAL